MDVLETQKYIKKIKDFFQINLASTLNLTRVSAPLFVLTETGLNDQLNIPQCIGHYGLDSYPCEKGFVPEEVFLERLPEIAANAISDACTGSNPRIPTQEEMEKLFKCVYYDTDVNF